MKRTSPSKIHPSADASLQASVEFKPRHAVHRWRALSSSILISSLIRLYDQTSACYRRVKGSTTLTKGTYEQRFKPLDYTLPAQSDHSLTCLLPYPQQRLRLVSKRDS